MLNIVIIQNFMVPYEAPLFSGLAKIPFINLKVFYCTQTYKTRRWPITGHKYPYEILPGFTLLLNKFACSFNPSIIMNIIKARPDVVVLSGGYNHITMQLAFIVCKCLNVPIIYRSDENQISRNNISEVARLARPIEQLMIKKSSAIICPGQLSKKYHYYSGAESNKIFIVPYTSANDDAYFHLGKRLRKDKENIKDKLGFQGKKIIIYTGRLVEEKGVVVLLNALSSLNKKNDNLLLILVGSGSKENSYKEYALKNHINNVLFLGNISELEKIIMYYSIADVFVLPSNIDLWGIVVNEAMLCGLPVIVSNNAGASEMIQNGLNGVIFKAGDPFNLSSAIESILYNDEYSSMLVQNSIVTIRNEYNQKNRVNKFLDCILFACNLNK